MSDYETGRQIARRGNFLNPAAPEEMRRGYNDELQAIEDEERKWRSQPRQSQSN